jgi:CDP-glycerol glycerophosphotransferase (TagB/SpsB family)
MLDHFFTVYGMGPGRLPADTRKEFFHRASVIAKRYTTKPDKAPLIGMRRLRYLVDDRFELFRLSMAPTAVSTWLTDSRPDWKKQRSAWKKNRKTAGKRWLYRNILVRGRLQPNLAMFWVSEGRQPAGDPKAIYEEMLRTRPDLQPMWALSPKAARSVGTVLPHVVIGSWECYRTLALTTYVVSDANLPTYFVKRPGTTFLQTLRGTPLETIYTDTRPYPAVSKGTNFGNLLKRADAWDYCLSSSAYATETIRRAIPSSFKILEYGQPRNDILFHDLDQIATSVREEFSLADDATIVLHSPVKRPWERTDREHIDLDDLLAHLPDESVVFTTVKRPGGKSSSRVFDVSHRDDLEHLAAASNLLITDYSPIMFDFALLNRPIVIYAEDYDAFSAVRGVYFDIRESPPGAVATSQVELLGLIESGDYDTGATRDLHAAFRSRFCEFEDADATSRVVSHVFR